MYVMFDKKNNYKIEEVRPYKVKMMGSVARYWYLRKHSENFGEFEKYIHENHVILTAFTLRGLARKLRKSPYFEDVQRVLDEIEGASYVSNA